MPTVEDTALIVYAKNLDMNSSKNAKTILKYFKNGGNVLCSITENSLNCVRGICCKREEAFNRYWVKQNSFWISPKNSVVTSQTINSHFPQFCKSISNDSSTSDILTPGYFFSQNESLPSSIQQTRLKLEFSTQNDSLQASDTNLPIFTNISTPEFDYNLFIQKLKTKYLGRSLIYVPIINSTFDVVDGKFLKHGLVVIANQQIQGRGRGQNKWLSPKGCAMTSFQLKTDLSSRLGQKASLLQHLTSLAVVRSLRDKLDLNLKWPNDIYYGSKVKMGGVVVLSNIFRNEMVFNIGLGFNLDNSQPTICVNDMLREGHLPKLSREEFFANFFNCLESLFDVLDNDDKNLETILDLYHEHWLHQDQRVQVQDLKEEVIEGIVKCIDNDGYLKVELPDGKMVSLQPGTNSFDMMQGLILPKKIN